MPDAPRPWTTTALLAAVAVAAAALLPSCATEPPALTEAMAAVCDEGTVAEPEPSQYDDDGPDDWARPTEELTCEVGGLTVSGDVYSDDPADRIQGIRDQVDSGDGGDYWVAVAEGDGRWVVVGASTAPTEETPEFLAPLTQMGFEVSG